MMETPLLPSVPPFAPAASSCVEAPAGSGRLFGIGVGPGDPELMTLKAVRLIRSAPVIAHFAAIGRKGNAWSIVESVVSPQQVVLPLYYPVTTEKLPPPFCYETALREFYDRSAEELAARLGAGEDVAVVCEGDPFFYGSFMYLFDRLAGRFACEVVPGVCSVVASAAVLGAPLVYRNQMLSILSGVLPAEELRRRLELTEAAAIMKLGSNFAKVRQVVQDLGLMDRALYVERSTMAAQRIAPLAGVDPATVPYFAMIIIPGPQWDVPC